MWLELRSLLAVNVVLIGAILLAFGTIFQFGRDPGFLLGVIMAFSAALIPVTLLWYRTAGREVTVPLGPVTLSLERLGIRAWPGLLRVFCTYLESLVWGAATAVLTGWLFVLVLGLADAMVLDGRWLRGMGDTATLALMLTWPFILTFSPLVLWAWQRALTAARNKQKTGA